jgi:hypothetical protein
MRIEPMSIGFKTKIILINVFKKQFQQVGISKNAY